MTKIGRIVIFPNKNGQMFSKEYCLFHYGYFKTVLHDENQFIPAQIK